MGPVKAVTTIISHFGVGWFKGISEEVEHSPATIAGLFFVWLTILALSFTAWMGFQRHAEAAELRNTTLAKSVGEMQMLISANTKALECSRKDRVIAAKVREIELATRLLSRAVDTAEKREIESQLADHTRTLKSLEATYKTACLQ